MDVAGKKVLDVGCGLAHLHDFFTKRFGAFTYTGVDLSEGMIQAARRRRPDLDLRVLDVLTTDPGGPYDLVVANGIFYLLGDDAFEHMKRLVLRLYELTAKVAAFTSLSTWADAVEPGEFHADPAATLAFGRTLTPRVVMRHDYLPHDFAVFLYRP
jgi:trans-aconitate methyltransferase